MVVPAGHGERLDALTGPLAALLDDVWARIDAEQATLAAAWPGARPTVRRLRLARLRLLVARLTAQVERLAATVIPAAIRDAWVYGATDTATTLNVAVAWQDADTASLTVIARDTYTDVLARTSHVRATTRTLIRAMARLQVAEKTTTGLTALQAARRLEQTMTANAIHAITYRDGTRHGLPEYTRMLMRTKTAETYQTAGLEQAQRLGVEWVEILDGPGCGLDGHDDPRKANGLILRASEAARYKLSHPNCRRVSTPRPDIGSAAEAAAERRAQPPGGGNGVPEPQAPLSGRGSRDAAGGLTPGVGAQASGRPPRPKRPGRPGRPSSPLRGA